MFRPRFMISLCALLLAACTTVSAQSSEPTSTPSPTALPTVYPENLQVTAGLERPTLPRPADPGPYIEATWDEPPERMTHATIEIYDEDGNGRPHWNDYGGPYGLFLAFETEVLRRNGCTIERTHVRITGDCLDRYRISVTRPYPSYPVGFLDPGTYYEVRVIFYSQANPDFWYAGLEGPSSTHTVLIPTRTPPTPTPRPTATPRPTPTPRPTATPAPIRLPGPTTPEIAPTPVSAASVFRNNPMLGAAGYFDNVVKQYRYYTRDGWTVGGEQVRTLTRFMPGEVYFLWVSGSAIVNGEALTCAGSNCMNVVVW